MACTTCYLRSKKKRMLVARSECWLTIRKSPKFQTDYTGRYLAMKVGLFATASIRRKRKGSGHVGRGSKFRECSEKGVRTRANKITGAKSPMGSVCVSRP